MNDRFGSGFSVDDNVVGRDADLVFVHAEPGGRVCLRVKIAQQRPLARLVQSGCQIDCRRRLSDAAFLVDQRNNPSHARASFSCR